jgi:hypothetical protein
VQLLKSLRAAIQNPAEWDMVHLATVATATIAVYERHLFVYEELTAQLIAASDQLDRADLTPDEVIAGAAALGVAVRAFKLQRPLLTGRRRAGRRTMDTFVIGRRYKTKMLFARPYVLRDSTLYVYDQPTQPGREAVVWEFQRAVGNRWGCAGVGRYDLPQYAGMFPV